MFKRILQQSPRRKRFEYVIRKVEDQGSLKLKGTHQLEMYAEDVNILSENTYQREIQKLNYRLVGRLV
jgi:hypothetical protein